MKKVCPILELNIKKTPMLSSGVAASKIRFMSMNKKI